MEDFREGLYNRYCGSTGSDSYGLDMRRVTRIKKGSLRQGLPTIMERDLDQLLREEADRDPRVRQVLGNLDY